MKKLFAFILIAMQCLVVYSTNRALLVGISKYPTNSGWCELASKNDIQLLKESLSGTFTVSCLLDEDATFDGICKSLKALQGNTTKGDTIFIHFSCHGQQVLPKGTTTEVDMLDEALIPYDAQSKFKKGVYEGNKHLVDDKLGAYIDAIRDKAGVNGLVIVILDACHSDTMNKGNGRTTTDIYRGIDEIFAENLTPQQKKELRAKSCNADTTKIEKKGIADVAYISACNSYQRNREIVVGGVNYGSLSFAIANAIKDTGISNFEGFVHNVFDIMSQQVPAQTPVLRTSLDISIDKRNVPTMPIGSQQENESSWYLYCVGIALLFAIIIYFVWKKKK